jgi:hypothetical protein
VGSQVLPKDPLAFDYAYFSKSASQFCTGQSDSARLMSLIVRCRKSSLTGELTSSPQLDHHRLALTK